MVYVGCSNMSVVSECNSRCHRQPFFHYHVSMVRTGPTALELPDHSYSQVMAPTCIIKTNRRGTVASAGVES